MALGSIEVPTAGLAGIEAADLADQDRPVVELVSRGHRVRRLGLVFVAEASPDGVDPGGQALLFPESPVANVDGVAAVVPHLAVAEIPETSASCSAPGCGGMVGRGQARARGPNEASSAGARAV